MYNSLLQVLDLLNSYHGRCLDKQVLNNLQKYN